MDKILVHGGHPLSGSIKISGSKNSALPILAATLLTKEQCVLRHVPDLSDTNYMVQILTHLGADVERASGTVSVRAEKIESIAPYEIVRKMRASICVIGPLLGRCGEATVSLPGGCIIGDRPIDLHLKGFEALGAAIRVENGNVKVFAPKLERHHQLVREVRSDGSRNGQRHDGGCLAEVCGHRRRGRERSLRPG
jgi:UDP-N-acetylglucosamine 1-carboxyvinyltransferase